MNGDVLTKVDFKNILNFHRQQNAMATMGVQPYEVSIPFGVVVTDDTNIVEFEEKPVKKYFINSGIYVLSPTALSQIEVGEYLDMPDLFTRIKDAGQTVHAFPLREYWIDVGRPDQLEKARDEWN